MKKLIIVASILLILLTGSLVALAYHINSRVSDSRYRDIRKDVVICRPQPNQVTEFVPSVLLY